VPHPDTGVLIVDVADPSQPELVGQIGPPEQALLGMTSRELRAIPDTNTLIVFNFACSDIIHGCTRDYVQFPTTGGAAEDPNLKFYDVSTPTDPVLIGQYDWNYSAMGGPHEFHLWRDPQDSARVLLFFSMPYLPVQVQVLDVSDPSAVAVVASWDPYADAGLDDPLTLEADSYVHSVSVTSDGETAFLSMNGSGLLVVDTSEIAAGVPDPQITLLHAVDARVDYSPPEHPGTHSAVAVPGRDLVFVSDEVYPVPLYPGCPWGWARLVDYADPSAPTIAGEYRVAENDWTLCGMYARDNVVFTAHNATVTEHLAIVSWHSSGLHVVDTSDPANPTALAIAAPDPLSKVAVEDPLMFALPVLTWSTPIVKDGLVYVVDIRNGLFIYEYTGPFEDEIATLAFAEGSSNLD
jgi:hypothetical protein